MKRINNGAPLLNSHGTNWSGPVLEDVIGVVEKAQLDDGGPMTGTVRFAKAEDDEDADRAFRKVQDGIIRNVSIGYRIYRLEKIEKGEGSIPVFRATDWEPYEASLVPMGADDGAKVRGEDVQKNDCRVFTRSGSSVTRKENSMENDDTRSETIAEDPVVPDPPAPVPAPVTTEPNERDLGAEQERERISGIMMACRAGRLPVTFQDRLIKEKRTLVEARGLVLEEIAKRDANVPVQSSRGREVLVTDDPLVHVRSGIENALLHRMSPELFKLDDVGRQYRGMSVLDIARSYLTARGQRVTNISKMELAGLALGIQTRAGMHTTSDFANLLADVTAKTLRKAYDEAPQTFSLISRRTTLPDFKPAKRLQIGEAPQLLEVLEHGEFKHGTVGEGKEQFQLATYGRIFAITRKALVNDDTDSFSRIATLFGRAARNLESDLVWAQITSNPNMGDGVALFHTASHGNLAAAGAVISVTTIGSARAAMRVQKGLDATTLLNLNPKFLIVPAALETIADQFVSVIQAAQPSNVNPFAGRLTVVVEPRLDVNSVTAYYLGADPGQIDMIEYATLEGEAGPMVESRIGFDIDGLEVKARHDFAAKVIDWRGFYKNPGA